jgi:hypothetical protein
LDLRERGRNRKRRKLHKEELYNSYASPNIIQGIKSRRVRWMGPLGRPGIDDGA